MKLRCMIKTPQGWKKETPDDVSKWIYSPPRVKPLARGNTLCYPSATPLRGGENMGIKLWEELAAQGMIIGMDAAEVLAKKIDALNAANLDLTERVLYAERERDEAREQEAAVEKERRYWYDLCGKATVRVEQLTAELAREDAALEEFAGECPSGGEHDWVREPEYCTKCLASREAE